jgi:hypothetical protein
MSSIYKEIHFETEICEHLAAQDWLYQENERQSMIIRQGGFSSGRGQQDRFTQFRPQPI